jgi:hypothetical protein
MSSADVTISCPHCRRQYAMKIDPERLQRLKTRATCGRCGKTFDAASRIMAAQQPAPTPIPTPTPEKAPVSETKRTDPRLPRVETLRASINTPPDVRDEMEELAREFAEAAARFTPVGIKRSPVATTAAGDAPPAPRPATVEEPTNPGVKHDGVAANASANGAAADAAATATDAAGSALSASAESPSAPAAPPAPTADEPRAAADPLSLDAEPAGDEEFAAAVPTLSRIAAAPKSWLEVADPGLAALQTPPSPGALALESLLNEGESIALPPPPAAS